MGCHGVFLRDIYPSGEWIVVGGLGRLRWTDIKVFDRRGGEIVAFLLPLDGSENKSPCDDRALSLSGSCFCFSTAMWEIALCAAM